MITVEEGREMQPAILATVNVKVSAGRLVTVKLDPDPVVAVLPGIRVRVHDPVEGRPFSTTLPVFTRQGGWVMGPIIGAAGGIQVVIAAKLSQVEAPSANSSVPEIRVTVASTISSASLASQILKVAVWPAVKPSVTSGVIGSSFETAIYMIFPGTVTTCTPTHKGPSKTAISSPAAQATPSMVAVFTLKFI
jgi:hypothetical protein